MDLTRPLGVVCDAAAAIDLKCSAAEVPSVFVNDHCCYCKASERPLVESQLCVEY